MQIFIKKNKKTSVVNDVFHRFYGRIAEKPNDHEEETLNAIKQNAGGLKRKFFSLTFNTTCI